MDKIAILIPSSDRYMVMPNLRWVADWGACQNSELFEPVLFWQEGFMEEGELVIEHPARMKTQWCILRCDPVGLRRYDGLLHALRRNGYRLAFYNGWCDRYRMRHDNTYSKLLRPEIVTPYQGSGGTYDPSRRGWLPGGDAYRGRLPMICRDDERVLKDRSGRHALILRDIPDDRLLDMINEWFERHPGRLKDGRQPFWFEQHVDVARVADLPIAWRVFSYMGRVFYTCPLSSTHGLSIPNPPEEILAEVTSFQFDYADLALDFRGHWWEVASGEAQYARLPDEAKPLEFYSRLEQEVLAGPDVPDWTWCLVGDIVQTHEFGEEHKTVRGTRHFRPGTKVYVSNAFWGQGGDRVCAIGIPRYCDHLVGVYMDSTLIENYRLEKVRDGSVLRAMFTNRLVEPFEIRRRTNLDTCWGDDERSRRDIEANAEYRNL